MRVALDATLRKRWSSKTSRTPVGINWWYSNANAQTTDRNFGNFETVSRLSAGETARSSRPRGACTGGRRVRGCRRTDSKNRRYNKNGAMEENKPVDWRVGFLTPTPWRSLLLGTTIFSPPRRIKFWTWPWPIMGLDNNRKFILMWNLMQLISEDNIDEITNWRLQIMKFYWEFIVKLLSSEVI